MAEHPTRHRPNLLVAFLVAATIWSLIYFMLAWLSGGHSLPRYGLLQIAFLAASPIVLLVAMILELRIRRRLKAEDERLNEIADERASGPFAKVSVDDL